MARKPFRNVVPFGKRKLFLVEFSSLTDPKQLPFISKFIVGQITREVQYAEYNDRIVGTLYRYDQEAQARALVHHEEYYLELMVPAEAISHETPDGQVFLHRGFKPQLLALKTRRHTYHYNPTKGAFEKEEEYSSTDFSRAQKHIYNVNPLRWLFHNRLPHTGSSY